jgi:putative Ca2+/H+ antiporter (TMEM165/GDT1 family)
MPFQTESVALPVINIHLFVTKFLASLPSAQVTVVNQTFLVFGIIQNMQKKRKKRKKRKKKEKRSSKKCEIRTI